VGRAKGNVKGKVTWLIGYARRNSSIGANAFFIPVQTCFGPSFPDKLSREEHHLEGGGNAAHIRYKRVTCYASQYTRQALARRRFSV
jgi:hypothetical protein